MDEPVARNGSITQLPNEILFTLLQNLPTCDLLTNGRLVSKRWKLMSTSICRDRLVKFKSNIFHSYSRRFLNCNTTIFKDVNDLPWSSIDLGVSIFDEGSSLVLPIVQAFGIQIQSLRLSIELPEELISTQIHQILRFTPNLQEFILQDITSQSFDIRYHRNLTQLEALARAEYTIEEDTNLTELELPKLKQLIIKYPEDSTFRTFLASNVFKIILPKAKATSLDVQLYDKISETDLCQTINLILQSTVENLSLRVPYSGPHEVWDLLATQEKMEIENLTIAFKGQITTFNYFRPLERFMSTCTKMRKLILNGFYTYETGVPTPVSKKFYMPILPNVTSLELVMMDSTPPMDFRNGPHLEYIECVQFTPFTPNQLPSLRDVKFEWLLGDWEIKPTDLFNSSSTFGSLRSLTLGSEDNYGGEIGGWGRANCFGSATKLCCTAERSEDIIDIGAYFQNLDQLNLVLKIDPIEEKLHEALVNSVQVFPRFKRLEKLYIENATRTIIRDKTAMLFTRFRPLELTIVNAKLSNDCISRLRQHHLGVTIENCLLFGLL